MSDLKWRTVSLKTAVSTSSKPVPMVSSSCPHVEATSGNYSSCSDNLRVLEGQGPSAIVRRMCTCLRMNWYKSFRFSFAESFILEISWIIIRSLFTLTLLMAAITGFNTYSQSQKVANFIQEMLLSLWWQYGYMKIMVSSIF